MSPLLLHSNINQYNINGLLCIYTEMFRIQTYCNHILSAAEGFGGMRQHARIQEFLSVLFSPHLILQLTEGVHGFIAEKTILIHYQGSRGGQLFSRGGGVQLLFQGWGVQMLISIETHIRTCYFPGGVRTPYPPLDPHMGNVIITGQYLSQSRFRH